MRNTAQYSHSRSLRPHLRPGLGPPPEYDSMQVHCLPSLEVDQYAHYTVVFTTEPSSCQQNLPQCLNQNVSGTWLHAFRRPCADNSARCKAMPYRLAQDDVPLAALASTVADASKVRSLALNLSFALLLPGLLDSTVAPVTSG